MTNSEKFKEVFGFEPDVNICIFHTISCPCKVKCLSADCDYGQEWWLKDYQEAADDQINGN